MIKIIIKHICKILVLFFIGVVPLKTQLKAEKKDFLIYTGISKSEEISINDKIAFSRLEEAFRRSGINFKPVLRSVPRALILTNTRGDGELIYCDRSHQSLVSL